MAVHQAEKNRVISTKADNANWHEVKQKLDNWSGAITHWLITSTLRQWRNWGESTKQKRDKTAWKENGKKNQNINK